MKQYTKVKNINDNYKKNWIKKWDIWYIIEIYKNNNYEVEFSDEDTWIDYAQVVIDWKNLEIIN